MNLPPGSRDLVRIVLGVLLILVLIGGALSILSPFLPALIWATMIVVATWPVLLQVQRALGGRRGPAAAAMTALLFVIVIAPLAVAISTVVRQAARLSDADPMVVAGRLGYDVMEWWVAAGSLDFPLTERPVGDRRAMPED